MKFAVYSLGFAVLLLMSSSCTIVNQSAKTEPPKTQLQIREIQTREFDTNDVKLIMKAVLNVLQDDDFVVKNAVPDLGLLTATKEIQLTGKTSSNSTDTDWFGIIDRMFSGKNKPASTNQRVNERFNKFRQIEVSVNISQIGSRCKVRANFQAKILDNMGEPVEVYTIDDANFYQDFFVKVDKGIFIQRQGF